MTPPDPADLGAVSHGAWKRWRVEVEGYPDHVFGPHYRWENMNGRMIRRCTCGQWEERHHEDMVDWADLPEAKRAKYTVMAAAVAEATGGGVVSLTAAELQTLMEMLSERPCERSTYLARSDGLRAKLRASVGED